MIKIKLIILICVTSLLNGCILLMLADRSAPLDAWEVYYKKRKNDTPFDQVKNDMIVCNFTSIYNNSSMDDEGYVKASLCMEKKGYRDVSIRGKGGICSVPYYGKTNACKATNN